MRRALTITTIRESQGVRTAQRLGAAVLLGWALSVAAQSQGQGTVVSVSISSPASGTVVTAPGNVTLTAAASVNHPDWVVLRVEYYAGAALIGSSPSAPYAFIWSNVAAGSYTLSAKAIATNPGQAKQDPATHPNMPTWVGVSAPVSFRVNAPPTVSLAAPPPASVFNPPANVPVTANAADSDGTVAKVDFYAGATLIGSATSAPFSIAWANPTPGIYSLTAVATDNDGAATPSTAVTV